MVTNLSFIAKHAYKEWCELPNIQTKAKGDALTWVDGQIPKTLKYDTFAFLNPFDI